MQNAKTQGEQITTSQVVLREAAQLQEALDDAVAKGAIREEFIDALFEQGLQFQLQMILTNVQTQQQIAVMQAAQGGGGAIQIPRLVPVGRS